MIYLWWRIRLRFMCYTFGAVQIILAALLIQDRHSHGVSHAFAHFFCDGAYVCNIVDCYFVCLVSPICA